MKKHSALLMLFLAFFLLSACGKAGPKDVIGAVKEGSYAKAREMYSTQIVGNITAENEVKDGLKQMMQDAVSDFLSNKISYDDAMLVLDKVERTSIVLLSDVNQPRRDIDTIASSRRAFDSGNELMDSGSFEEAMNAFSKVDPLSPLYDEARDKALVAEKALTAEKISAAEGLEEGEDAISAIQLLNDAKQAVLTAENVSRLDAAIAEIENAYTSASLKEAEALSSSGDYKAAISFLQNRIDEYANVLDVALMADKINELKNAVVMNTLRDAADLLDRGRADAAVSAVNDALTVQDSKLLTIARDEVKEYAGIFLTEMEPDFQGEYLGLAKNVYNISDYDRDAAGNTYDSNHLICPCGGRLNSEYAAAGKNGTIVYHLGSRFDRLQGTLYLPYISRAVESPKCFSSVKIYGDDVLLYEAPVFLRGTYDPVPIDLDVAGVSALKIAMYGVWAESSGWAGIYHYHPMVCAADMRVSRAKKAAYDPLQVLLDYAGQSEDDFVTAILARVNKAEEAGDRIAAIDTLRMARVLSENTSLKNALSEQMNSCLSEAKTQAAGRFADARGYTGALRAINLAISRVGEKNELVAARSEYMSYIPVPLVSLDYDIIGEYLSIGTEYSMDSDEVNHSGTYTFYPGSGSLNTEFARAEEDGCIEYYLNGKYGTLTGTVYLPYVSRSAEPDRDSAVAFKVYGDDRLLYDCPALSRDRIRSVELNVNIASVKVLRIVMLGVQVTSGSFGMYSYAPMICACDLAVCR